VRADGVVDLPPALDQHLRLEQSVEHLAGQELVSQLPVWPAPVPGKPRVRSPRRGRACHAHARPYGAASPGPEVELRTPSAARCCLPQDRLVQLRIRQEPLQPGVLLLEILQPLRLVRSKPAGLPLPAVLGLLRHAKLPHHLRHGLTSGQLDLGLAKLPDDLLRGELLSSWHLVPSLGCGHPGFSLPKWPRLRGAGQSCTPACSTPAIRTATISRRTIGSRCSSF